ncbi:MAG: diguanylate cyclase [Merismopedia sp. SIO2A8]|nr:diguanylate cyclase [Merismopedia sp. SIO2A8]
MTGIQPNAWDDGLAIKADDNGWMQKHQNSPQEKAVQIAIDRAQQDRSSLPITELAPARSQPQLPKHSLMNHCQQNPYYQIAYKRMHILGTVLDMLKTGTCSIPLQEQAVREACSLTGTLQNLGLVDAVLLAQKMTDCLMATPTLNPSRLKTIEDSLAALTELLPPSLHGRIISSVSSSPLSPMPLSNSPIRQSLSSHRSIGPMLSTPDGLPDHHPQPYPSYRAMGVTHLLIVDDDVALADELQAIAIARGMHTRLAVTFSDARSLVSCYQPDIVLLNLCTSHSAEDGLSFLAELSQTHASVPVVVFTEQTGLADRLNATRLGAKGFLQKPVPVDDIFQTLLHTLKRGQVAEAHLLVLTDDPPILDQLAQLFQSLGFSPTLLSDPVEFWAALDHNAPDLLILDVKTSKVNGLDLCRVLRNDLRWSDLPIILLSDRTDRIMLQKVFAAGADDYVSKPIFEPELIARVNNRLERSRLLHELAETDSLTGLTNRRKATLDINRLIHLAQRQQKTLSFVIFDLDRFKQINDHYGHNIGDQVLRQTGHLLKQAFRRVDVIARWGGDEFVLGLFDSSAEQSAKRMAQVTKHLHEQTVHSPEITSLEVTYSVGIAEYSKDGNDLDALYHAADQALYHAKVNGRDQICVAQSLSVKNMKHTA